MFLCVTTISRLSQAIGNFGVVDCTNGICQTKGNVLAVYFGEENVYVCDSLTSRKTCNIREIQEKAPKTRIFKFRITF